MLYEYRSTSIFGGVCVDLEWLVERRYGQNRWRHQGSLERLECLGFRFCQWLVKSVLAGEPCQGPGNFAVARYEPPKVIAQSQEALQFLEGSWCRPVFEFGRLCGVDTDAVLVNDVAKVLDTVSKQGTLFGVGIEATVLKYLQYLGQMCLMLLGGTTILKQTVVHVDGCELS